MASQEPTGGGTVAVFLTPVLCDRRAWLTNRKPAARSPRRALIHKYPEHGLDPTTEIASLGR